MLIFSPTHTTCTCKVDRCLQLRGCQIDHIQSISASDTHPAVVPAGDSVKTCGGGKKKQQKENDMPLLHYCWKRFHILLLTTQLFPYNSVRLLELLCFFF